MPTIPFQNTYARLPDRFYARLAPTPVAAPRLVRLNRALAEVLGLDADYLASAEGVEVLAGNRAAEGSEPLAMAYAGHQFGGWSPQLGDGRAILLGEVVGVDGVRRDLQLKGSGPTPFSRMGDGRAALGPVLREYIVSEAMWSLGVPTTRALAAVLTGEVVPREAPFPGAVLTRVAQSHIRVGTFQYFAARNDAEALKLLADHVIARHYPEAAQADRPYRALLDAVIAAQARLIGQWMGAGFIHGVMNTDNMTISGETIDYGPCAFMDAYDPNTVYSSIDHMGRYAYANQPAVAQWNLARLAQALLPLLDTDETAAIAQAQQAVDGFPALFQTAWLAVMARKIGLAAPRGSDAPLINDLLNRMAQAEADFTLTFRALCDAAEGDEAAIRARLQGSDDVDIWLSAWRARLAEEPRDAPERAARMRAVNPLYIPRNHLVEEAIAAAQSADYQPFERLIDVLAAPFVTQPDAERYTLPPKPEEVVRATFCGT